MKKILMRRIEGNLYPLKKRNALVILPARRSRAEVGVDTKLKSQG